MQTPHSHSSAVSTNKRKFETFMITYFKLKNDYSLMFCVLSRVYIISFLLFFDKI